MTNPDRNETHVNYGDRTMIFPEPEDSTVTAEEAAAFGLAAKRFGDHIKEHGWRSVPGMARDRLKETREGFGRVKDGFVASLRGERPGRNLSGQRGMIRE